MNLQAQEAAKPDKQSRPYNFRITDMPLAFSGESSSGLARQVFENLNFLGRLERIAVECTLFRGGIVSKDTAFGEETVLTAGGYVMLIAYKAFGPKKVLWRHTHGLVASSTEIIRPQDMGGINTPPKNFVEFAISEAERLGRHYGITVEMVYHGDPKKHYWVREHIQDGVKSGVEAAK